MSPNRRGSRWFGYAAIVASALAAAIIYAVQRSARSSGRPVVPVELGSDPPAAELDASIPAGSNPEPSSGVPGVDEAPSVEDGAGGIAA